MMFDVFDEVIMPYSTIPVYVSMISSQNGAITTVDDESGNDLGEVLMNGVPKLSRPFELI